MRSKVTSWGVVTVLAAGILLGENASAQAETGALEPPRILRFVAAARPAEASDREVAVLLELTIDEQGHVAEAAVTESAGEAFDSAALEAARKFDFSPALRAGEPVRVKLAYRYVFRPVPPAAEPREARAGKPPLTAAPPAVAPAPVAPDDGEYGATAEVEAPPRSATRRSFKAEELARVPGVRGDAIRAVDIMPGVLRGEPFDGGTPLIRGASPIESQVFLDGIPVPLLFHFGGITSFFQSRLLERVELYPGNFSARYGRVTGGVVEAEVRDLDRPGVHGMVDLSVLDSAALVEASIDDATHVALAARRSNVDFFFEQFVPDDAYNVVAAPVYYDYQALARFQLSPHTDFRLMAYGSRDAIELVFSEPDESDPALRGEVGGAIAFHHLNARFHSKISELVEHETSVTLGFLDQSVQFGPFEQDLEAWELHGRSDLALRLSSAIEVDMGLDFRGQLASGRYAGPRPSGWDNADPASEESLGLSETIRLERSGMDAVQPGAWLELLLRPSERVLIAPGVRVDYFDNARAWSVDPRLSVRVEVLRGTTLKGGVGLFTQPPQWYELNEDVGNPDLKPYRAVHLGAGVEQKLGAGVEVGVEGFYKRLFDRVVGTEGGRPPYLVNDGEGRIAGAELSLGLRPGPGTFGYFAYTLSRSERRDRSGPWLLWNNDQTHVLSAVAAQQLGRGWEIGARFRYVTGNPETPVNGAVYDAGIDQYRPIYGRFNSERQDAFHQLDVRVEKRWKISELTLAAYLEVINAYNAQNPVGTSYSYDYSKKETEAGLPIVPNLGLRGEL
ncbi:MAG TPA: TonB-dependent receptor [Polyangiaceae bacterium]|nr:TonB-dependent receptor [Polyangiaceae bacterium]